MLHKDLLRETKKESTLFLAVVSLGVTGGALAVAQAWYLAAVIHEVFLAGANLTAVTDKLIFLAILMAFRAAVIWLNDATAHALAGRIKHSLRRRLAGHLLELGPIPLSRRQSGDIVNVLTEGIESLEAYFARYIPQLASAVLVPVLILGFVVGHDTVSALLMLVTAPLIPFFMILIGRMADKLNKRQWEKLSLLSAHFLDVLQGLTTLKLFGRSKEQVLVISRMAGDFRDTTLGVLRVAFLSSLTLELFATISTAIVAVTVGLKLLYGDLIFVNAFFILLLAPEYYLPLRLLGTHFHAGMSGAAAAGQIFDLLSLPLSVRSEGTMVFDARGDVSIAFRDVTFAYDGGARPALRGATFTLAANSVTALVGPSGGGKSTVAGLLLRFMDPQAGEITVNGQPLTSFTRESWLSQVAYVPQQPHLFAGTVADNIAMGRSCERSDIEQAAKDAGAHEFITELPQGYDTVVGEGGRGLSGGEKQRIAIARAFLRDATVVILDEATAHLDPHNEHSISQALDKLLQGRTVLIIAHRLRTIRQADHIIVLNSGAVCEAGRHEELLNRQGLYASLACAGGGGS